MAKIVVALGGNALGDSVEEQKELVKIPAKKIANLVKYGHQVVVTHGNGPQVGMIANAFGDAKKQNNKNLQIPLAEAGAMSQGYIGYHMTIAIENALKSLKLENGVVYLLSNTIVDSKDEAFKNPTKPVGPFFETQQEAQNAYPNDVVIEDSNRGYRKVVPSPRPIDITNASAIQTLLEKNTVVVTGGGGGIPIINQKNKYIGLDAVIDKDFTSAKIAEKIDADLFIILTSVNWVYLNYGTPESKFLKSIEVSELEELISKGSFAKGSILPKLEACLEFVKSGKDKKAIIANLNKVNEALKGTSGTIIYKK